MLYREKPTKIINKRNGMKQPLLCYTQKCQQKWVEALLHSRFSVTQSETILYFFCLLFRCWWCCYYYCCCCCCCSSKPFNFTTTFVWQFHFFSAIKDEHFGWHVWKQLLENSSPFFVCFALVACTFLCVCKSKRSILDYVRTQKKERTKKRNLD